MISIIPFRQVTIPAFLPVILGLLLLSACTPTGETQASAAVQTTADADSNWSAMLSLSGGFAGQMREISIDQRGKAVLIDKKTHARFEKQVTPQELQDIAKLVKLLAVDLPPDQRSSRCRDCITYRLVTTVDKTKRQLVTDDVKLHDSGAKDLILALAALASEMMKKN